MQTEHNGDACTTDHQSPETKAVVATDATGKVVSQFLMIADDEGANGEDKHT